MKVLKNTIFYMKVFLDAFVLTLAFFTAHFILIQNLTFEFSKKDILLFIALIFTWYFVAVKNNLYDDLRLRNFSYEAVLVIKSILYHFIFSIVIIYLLDDKSLPRDFIIYYILLLLSFLLIEKSIVRQVLNILRRKGKNLSTILIIGAGPVGMKFFETINKNAHLGYRILGFLDDKTPSQLNGEYIGPISELDRLLDEMHVDNVIVALPNYATKKIEDIIRTCENRTTRVYIIPDYFKFFSQKYNLGIFGNIPFIMIRDDKINDIHNRFVKRLFDIIFSILVIVLILSWLLPIIALAVKLTSKGPVFFKQERLGRNNKKFKVIKIRSMHNDSTDIDEKGKYRQATKNDPRITKVGKFLRRTNLDELPQFFNVLVGDMSVVGPRPHPIPLNTESKDIVERYMLRHLVKPGLTGWAQVNGFRGETKEIELMKKRIEYDLWYIENWSFFLDIQIILMTIWKMFKGDPNAI